MKNKIRLKTLDSGKILIYVVLLLGMAITVTPMIYMISTSLRPNGTLYEYPPRLFPRLSSVTVENYDYILVQQTFYRKILNSALVTIATVLLAAFVSSALGFCLARFRFPGKKILFALIMATMIIPPLALIIPQFELIVFFKLINRLLGLIPVYAAWVIPFSTFMLTGFIEYIPRDFDEAMYIDGADVFRVYSRIIVPLSGPAIASISVFNFLTAWEEYPWALTVINDDNIRTLPIAIAEFFGIHNFTQWGYVFAMSVISLLPVIAVYIVLQRYFVTGLYSGGIKA